MELLKEGILDAMPFPMWVFDNESLKFQEVNTFALNRYGYSKAEFLNLSLEDIRPDLDVLRLYEHLHLQDDVIKQAPKMWRHQTKSGEIFWVKVRCQRFQHKSKPYTAVMVQEAPSPASKISHLSHEQQLSFILENSLDIFVVLNMCAQFVFATPSLEKCTGMPLETLMGTCAYERVHPEDKLRVQEAFQLAIQLPQLARRISFRYQGRDGHYRHFEAIGKSVSGIAEIQGISLQVRDVTDRVEAEETLRMQHQFMK